MAFQRSVASSSKSINPARLGQRRSVPRLPNRKPFALLPAGRRDSDWDLRLWSAREKTPMFGFEGSGGGDGGFDRLLGGSMTGSRIPRLASDVSVSLEGVGSYLPDRRVPNEEILEYVCTENERDREHMIGK